ncbi:branched-chain amino acid ABC transporter permease [Ktedonobacteria bacterium brp13]|nr:branched-chain amino acid ABC transporter permease [Ktedonobacteria bacterium brp13]
MAVSVSSRRLLPDVDTRKVLIKWLVALLIATVVFSYVWSGDAVANSIWLGVFYPQNVNFDHDVLSLLQKSVFLILVYGGVIALAGYLVAADTGRRGAVVTWLDIVFVVVVPIIMISVTANLLIGLGLGAVIWALYIFVRNRIQKARNYVAPTPLANLEVMDDTKQAALLQRARLGGFWFATAFALIALVVDLIFFAIGSLPVLLLIWTVVRTLLLPLLGYVLGMIGGRVALLQVIKPSESVTVPAENGGNAENPGNGKRRNWLPGNSARQVTRKQQLQYLSAARASEEAHEVVPSDLPLQSKGANRFYMLLLFAFLLFYPAIDPILFGSGSVGRITSYGDIGYYVILALGLNIVVGFAGLLDLGYVAFFVIGSYAWAIIGSPQLTRVTSIAFNVVAWPWIFWPMLLGAALLTAFFGVILGAPTLRLRGDYLAIVTLGFGEIIPIVFLRLTNITGGSNGIVGINTPALCVGSACVNWQSPTPYYYLILVLIAFCVFANVRLRDSRLGRAWVALREDEIAAASSGINLVNTKLFAFAAGAFFAGIAGVYHAAKLGTVNPNDFNYTDSVIFLAMVVIGGLGSIPGVIVGAVFVYAINILILAQLDTYASDPSNFLHIFQVLIPNFTFSNIRNLLFGLTLILIMIFRPEGLIPQARRKRELRHQKDEEDVDVGSLDALPGTADFEAEIRVE